jgi:hypothetical protein
VSGQILSGQASPVGFGLAVPTWFRRWLSRTLPPGSLRLLLWRSRREKALERVLDDMADRVARTELALLRQEAESLREQRRAAAAEAALARLQDMLDDLRDARHGA